VRILFCPLASHGFVYPMLGMARALEQRGHATAFVTDESFGEELARHGQDRVPRGPLRDGPSFEVAKWSEAYAVAMQVKHLEYALDRFRPDLIVGLPLTLGALLVAERTRMRIAVLGFCTYHWPKTPRAMNEPADEHERRLAWRLREWTRLYNEARALFKAPPVAVDVLDTPALGDLLLARSIPGFGLGDGDGGLPAKVTFVGDCLWEPPAGDPELQSWLQEARGSGAPIVYLQRGRFFDLPDFWPSFKEAALRADLRVAVATDRMDCEVGDCPSSWLVRPFLPQGAILRHADLVVTAGNTTAVLGAVTAGVPALLLPGGGEQPDVAAWCEQVGMAKVLAPPECVTGPGILAALHEILEDPRYREQAAGMQERFAPYRGFERAASALESLAGRP
jgi:UDP:flavonoid glycosyltransferase YjiC (YdhE family)